MQLHFSTTLLRATNAVMVFILLSACLQTPTPVPTPTVVPSPTPELPVDAFTMNQRLARTVSIGNALEAPNEGDWGVTLKEEYFQLIRQ